MWLVALGRPPCSGHLHNYPDLVTLKGYDAVEVGTCSSWEALPAPEAGVARLQAAAGGRRRLRATGSAPAAALESGPMPTVTGNAIVWRCGAAGGRHGGRGGCLLVARVPTPSCPQLPLSFPAHHAAHCAQAAAAPPSASYASRPWLLPSPCSYLYRNCSNHKASSVEINITATQGASPADNYTMTGEGRTGARR